MCNLKPREQVSKTNVHFCKFKLSPPIFRKAHSLDLKYHSDGHNRSAENILNQNER